MAQPWRALDVDPLLHIEQREHPHPKDGPPELPVNGVPFNQEKPFKEPLQRLKRFCEDNGLTCKYTSACEYVEVELLHGGRRVGKHWRLNFNGRKQCGRREAQTLLCNWMLEYAKWLISSGVVAAPIVRRTESWLTVLPSSVKIVKMTEMGAPDKEAHAALAFPLAELQSVGVVAFDFEGCDAEDDYTVVQVACARATGRARASLEHSPLTPAAGMLQRRRLHRLVQATPAGVVGAAHSHPRRGARRLHREGCGADLSFRGKSARRPGIRATAC